jgi:hypothetical protein
MLVFYMTQNHFHNKTAQYSKNCYHESFEDRKLSITTSLLHRARHVIATDCKEVESKILRPGLSWM